MDRGGNLIHEGHEAHEGLKSRRFILATNSTNYTNNRYFSHRLAQIAQIMFLIANSRMISAPLR